MSKYITIKFHMELDIKEEVYEKLGICGIAMDKTREELLKIICAFTTNNKVIEHLCDDTIKKIEEKAKEGH